MTDTADTIINLINLRMGKDFDFRLPVELPYRIVDAWVNTRKHTGVTLSQVAKALGPEVFDEGKEKELVLAFLNDSYDSHLMGKMFKARFNIKYHRQVKKLGPVSLIAYAIGETIFPDTSVNVFPADTDTWVHDNLYATWLYFKGLLRLQETDELSFHTVDIPLEAISLSGISRKRAHPICIGIPDSIEVPMALAPVDRPILKVNLPADPAVAAMVIIGRHLAGLHTWGTTWYNVSFTAIEEEFPGYFDSDANFAIFAPFGNVANYGD